MKEAPFRLALFSILITVIRIALFVFIIDKGYGETLGKIFAVTFAFLMAAGTYLSAFSVRFKNSRWAGLAGLALFGAGDLLFNEAAVVYVTSSATLIPPESNFLNMSSSDLLYSMQVLTLVFGAMPTLAAAVLGWMQASFYKVTELNKAGLMGRISTALGRIVMSWGVGIAVRFEGGKKGSGNFRKDSEEYEGKNAEVLRWDWRRLSDQEKEELRGKEPRKIREEYTGMDGKTSENWYFRANGRKYSEVKKLMAGRK